jgi:transposase
MNQYPADVRDRLLRALDAGLAREEATRPFGVSDRTIRRWQQRRRDSGRVVPSRRAVIPRRIAPAPEAAPGAEERAQPDATLAEHCATWEAAHGVTVSAATMSRALTRLGWPLKQNP